MTIELANNSDFIADYFESTAIPTGQSSDFTISCPAGKRLKLSSMVSNNNTLPNITVAFGSRVIVDDYTLQDINAAGGVMSGEFMIGNNGNVGGNCDQITGKQNENIVVSFGLATVEDILLGYQVGV